jgi:hypothetical protein
MAGKKSLKGKALPIEWHVPDDIPIRYATNIVVQRLENEYLISFFEVRPPIVLGSPEEVATKVNSLDSIRANCVAQIMVAENKMPEFVKALQLNLERSIVLTEAEGKEE